MKNRNSERVNIARRKRQFAAFLLAFIMAFMNFGTVLAWAADITIDNDNYENIIREDNKAKNNYILQPGEKIYFNGNPTTISKFYYYDEDFQIRDKDHDVIVGTPLGNEIDASSGHQVLAYNGTQIDKSYFAGWKIYGTPGTNSGQIDTLYLYAMRGFKVNFNPDNGSAVFTKVVVGGNNVEKPTPDPVKPGYTFEGWYQNDPDTGEMYDEKFDFNFQIEEDTYLTAKWKPISYTLKFDPNGGSGTMADIPMTYDQEKKLPANTFKNSDKKFLGWNTKADGSGTAYKDEDTVKNLSETQDATATLYAQWEKPKEPEDNKPQGDGDLYVPFDETGKLFQVAIVKRTDTTLKLSWNKVPGADRYVIFGKPCFHFPLKKIAEIKDPDTLTYIHTGLIKDKYYKYQLRAYKGNRCIAKTLIVHGTTLSDKNTVAGKIEITNVVGGTMEKTSGPGKITSLYSASANSASANGIDMGTVRLKKKEKIKITAKEVPEESGKTIDRHRPRHNGKEKRQIEYQSTDKNVAKVTKTGRIKARNTGECIVFANAQNGVLYRIRVIVE